MRNVEDGVKSALESVVLHLLLDVVVDEAADVCEDVRDLISDQEGLKIRSWHDGDHLRHLELNVDEVFCHR